MCVRAYLSVYAVCLQVIKPCPCEEADLTKVCKDEDATAAFVVHRMHAHACMYLCVVFDISLSSCFSLSLFLV